VVLFVELLYGMRYNKSRHSITSLLALSCLRWDCKAMVTTCTLMLPL
jgi:hypothetical protein